MLLKFDKFDCISEGFSPENQTQVPKTLTELLGSILEGSDSPLIYAIQLI